MLSSTFQFGMPHGLAAHVRLLEGISAFHTPKAFGGGHEAAQEHFLAAIELVWGVVEDVELREIPGYPALRITLAETYAMARTDACCSMGQVHEAEAYGNV